MATLTALTATTVLASADNLYVVDGANSRKITWGNVLDALEAQGAAPATFIASGTFADARIAASNVTQHEAALTLSAAQVTAAGALMDSEMTDLAGVKALDTSTLAALGANIFTGTQDFNGQQVEGMVSKVVGTVSGVLTTADHSGNVLVTSGNITVPTTAGFNAVIIAGGAHTVTFNGTVSAAMAAGDVMTVVVQSSSVIHAVLTAAADKVAFT